MKNKLFGYAHPGLLVVGILSFFVFYTGPLHACGYSFVGGCSTHIGLEINGTRDSFPVDVCAFGGPFDGLDLGNIRTLKMRFANAITWESCVNNVTNVTLYYRVYEVGQAGSIWRTLVLNQDSTHLQGPYTTRYRSLNTNLDMSQGLGTGKRYLLEVYYMAAIDTLGDDFIPETTLLQNNKGSNYKMFFTYGGAGAPPFTTVVTRRDYALCYKDSSGIAGVSIFGNAADLRYHWSSSPDNYHTIFRLSEGTYTVTVTSSNADPQIRTIAIGQPTPITAVINDIEPAGCNNRAGHATAVASGGTAPYRYTWSSGTTGNVGSFPTAGVWTLTIQDDHNCVARFSVQIPANNTIAQRVVDTEICYGDTLISDRIKFFKTGEYQYTLPNAAGCDTLVRLSLKVIYPDSALLFLPDTAQIVCLSPSIDLCARSVWGETYTWKKNNVVLGTQPCYTATSGGDYEIAATLAGRTRTCVARKMIHIDARLLPPVVTTASTTYLLPCRTDSVGVRISASANVTRPVFEWRLNGKSASQQPVLDFRAAPSQLANITIVLSVTDEYGCSINFNQFTFAPVTIPDPLLISLYAQDASGPQNADGEVEVSALAGVGVYQYKWSNGATTAVVKNLLPGTYCVTVEDESGCTRRGCQTVSYTSAVYEADANQSLGLYPNPVLSGETVFLKIPAKETFSYTLTDAGGHLHATGPLSGNAFALPETLPAGCYTFSVQCSSGILHSRLFIYR